ncbi:hypothetical protein [Dictyobacter formicarum]|uniref:Uncharacterized protein n=1 Tax=Dictyobacter formicarum TaxID=2778368 RepID=A0ABQ3VA24_9CHLR|nr:hypothetical protein [Dictyobacter formicarum]GHO82635.1 hypothetical protein KSZ_06410 [Dictyobacter formicarum]
MAIHTLHTLGIGVLSTQALATASLTVLQPIRGGARSLSDLKLLALPRLAAERIGVKDLIRQRGLVLEQGRPIDQSASTLARAY